ncbi:MAG: hypothetical protein J0L53_09035 [Spirochaetes bacterium]|nr:hypothetical protein [Spirochaetota bacterium]
MSSKLSNIVRRWQFWVFVGGAASFGYLVCQNYTLKKNYDRLARRADNPASTRLNRNSVDAYHAGAIKNTILRRGSDFSLCFKKYLAVNTSAATGKVGKVKLDWQIKDTGKVKLPGVVFSDFTDVNFLNCLTGVVANTEFPPPPSDGYYVEHTLTFEKK